MVYENVIKMPHGFWIGTNFDLFDLGFNNYILKDNCINYSYLSGRIIIVKKANVVSIFSAIPKQINGRTVPEKLGEFSYYSPNLYTEVIIGGYSYLVDYNCQVTCRKL